jgi:hypothetical protein
MKDIQEHHSPVVRRWVWRVAATSITTAALVACGGNSAPPVVIVPPPAPTQVAGTDIPIVATQNVADLIAFERAQQAATSDFTDPILVGDATLLASDDSAEPSDV